MSIAVKKSDGTIDIITESGGWNMSAADYYQIREVFENGYILNNCVLRPSAIIGYLNESNPKLMEAEIEIEKNKLRRKLTSRFDDYAKFAIPFVIIIIGAAVAFKMLDSGSAATIVQTAADAASTTPSAPVTIR